MAPARNTSSATAACRERRQRVALPPAFVDERAADALMADRLRVVAGVVRDDRRRVLLAQRPAGKHLAGLWEYPGGKCEDGELPIDALARELREEIGIVVESARPLIGVPHRYPGKDILLDVWDVAAYSATPQPREGQRLAWVATSELYRVAMPPADRPVAKALALPKRYAITPALGVDYGADIVRGVEKAGRGGASLVQLRLPTWPREQLAEIARRALIAARGAGAQLLLNGDARLAMVLGFDGLHLPAAAAAILQSRPVPRDRWLGVSCHDAAELAHAQSIGADFATLGPIYPTPSHADATPLGWERFAEFVDQVALPVYALGGLEIDDLDEAIVNGAQGIAAIRAFWPH